MNAPPKHQPLTIAIVGFEYVRRIRHCQLVRVAPHAPLHVLGLPVDVAEVLLQSPCRPRTSLRRRSGRARRTRRRRPVLAAPRPSRRSASGSSRCASRAVQRHPRDAVVQLDLDRVSAHRRWWSPAYITHGRLTCRITGQPSHIVEQFRRDRPRPHQCDRRARAHRAVAGRARPDARRAARGRRPVLRQRLHRRRAADGRRRRRLLPRARARRRRLHGRLGARERPARRSRTRRSPPLRATTPTC